MNKKILVLSTLLALLAFPDVLLAQGGPDASEILQIFADFMESTIAFLVGLAILFFLWGVLKYVTAGGDAAKRDEGRNVMLYGVIALFVIVSVWGLVNILVYTFDLDTGTIPDPPDLPTVL